MTAADFRALRTGLGWSQDRLAEALGVTQPAVSQWESGVNPIPEPVARLALLIAAGTTGGAGTGAL